MTWEEKFMALKAISTDAAIRMRSPGDWYVSLPGVEIKDGPTLESQAWNGGTPEAAILTAWLALTMLSDGKYIVLSAYRDNRRAVRWNGFMWEEFPEAAVSR